MAGKRQVSITTPLGEDLLLASAHIQEELGRLFRYDVALRCKVEDLNVDDIIGQGVTINLELENGDTRYFHGVVSRFSQQGSTSSGYAMYTAVIQPWFWFLTRTSDCRIFQEKSVPDILKEVFSDNGFSDYEESLSGTYRTWEYCVQYRETDFNFLSRLMEQEGIYYFFKHEEGKHILVLADAYNSHEKIAGESEIAYHLSGVNLRKDANCVSNWSTSCEVQPGNYALTDYDFKKPKSDLRSNRIIQRDHAQSESEIFDYPGEYIEPGEGEDYALRRIEELHVNFSQAAAETDSRGMILGGLFKLKEHPRSDQNREYLVISCNYELAANDYSSGGDSQEPFQCNFSAIDSKVPFRSARLSAKPAVQGPQTAVVVGPAGEEIYPDEYGRVKVQFHWDRYGKMDENSSCWIRVAQSWAGPGWGAQFIPRIGQEVMVEFLEGDPDRPIITGRVYNADNMPTYSLPDNKTRSGIRSQSTPGGGVKNSNELRFEDKKGEEQLFLHAEKNHDIRVKNNAFEYVGNKRHLIVKKDQLEEVGGDLHNTVDGDHNEKVKGTASLDVAMDLQEKVGMKYGLDAGVEIHQKAGTNVVIEAGASLTLKVGGNFINISPAGVSIKGAMVMVNSGGAAGSGSGCSPDAPILPQEADFIDAAKKAATLSSVTTRQGGAGTNNPQAQALKNAARDGTPFCEKCEAAK